MKKKVIQLIHGLSMGGAESIVKDYCFFLDYSRFDVILICLKKYNSEYEKMLEKSGCKIIYISDYFPNALKKSNNILFRIIKIFLRYLIVKSFIKKENPDIIHTHLLLNSYVYFAKPSLETKIFHTVHTVPNIIWGESRKGKIDKVIVNLLMSKYEFHFIALHDEMTKQILELFPEALVHVLNNGIDFNRFNRAANVCEIRDKEGIPKNAYVLGHVGRFSKEKNHEFLVRVFFEVKKIKKNAFLLLVGAGEEKEKISQQLRSLGVFDSVKILSNRTDIPELMSIMDVFIFPSMYEGLPVTLVEAQKIGIPCIVSDTITQKVIISNLVVFMSLSVSPYIWAKEILRERKIDVLYNNLGEWDMNNIIKELECMYMK